jgi:ribonuclease HIII
MNYPSNTLSYSEINNHIGCDESGIGDYFGGIVVCAAYADKQKYNFYKSLGVTDSKKLSNKQIMNIYENLKKSEKFVCLSCTPAEYNHYIEKYKNAHIIKSFLHNQAIKRLIDKYSLKDIPVILDQFAPKNTYYKYFEKLKIIPEKISIFETKAELKYIGVALASIIARANFLLQINELKKTSSIDFKMGASDHSIISDARKIYERGGMKELQRFVKISFSTTKKVLAYENK